MSFLITCCKGYPSLAIHGGTSYMMSKTQHCQVSSMRVVLVSAHRRDRVRPADPVAVLAVSTPSRCTNGEVPVLSEAAAGALNRKMSYFLCFCRLYFSKVKSPCRPASDFASNSRDWDRYFRRPWALTKQCAAYPMYAHWVNQWVDNIAALVDLDVVGRGTVAATLTYS